MSDEKAFATALDAIRDALDHGDTATLTWEAMAESEHRVEQICHMTQCSAFVDWVNETVRFERAN